VRHGGCGDSRWQAETGRQMGVSTSAVAKALNYKNIEAI